MDALSNTATLERETGEIRQVTLVGMLLNLFLTVVKILAGYFGNSQSVIADGIHSLSDCSTDVAVMVGVKYWNQPPDECHPYGHRRIEAMISVLIGAVLALAGLFLGYGAYGKFMGGNYVVPAGITLTVAIVSIVVKEWLFRWTYKVAERLKSSAMKANAWHHRSDCLSSIPVAFAIGMAMVNPKWAILDPLATFAVSLFIIQAAYKIVSPSIRELADAGADTTVLNKIEAIVLQVDGVGSVHAVRSRFHGSGLYVDLHIQIDENLTVRQGHEIAGRAKRRLLDDGPDIVDVLVHIEPAD
ncbi:MAG: cation transporter [Erysipelotrichia bacterium]|nr:cation diffusion facilitator family transporter [Candidatus Riflebacteria bacterium]NCB40343.1 cation transporter [Erysipelotrichia bacterium]